MNQELLKAAREKMKDICPLDRDCGKKCGAACCQPDEDGQGGMYLFPGEEELAGGEWASILPAMMGERETNILVCSGECERDRRPLGCMIFPLTPVVDEEGNVKVRFDYRARRMCPLLKFGVRGLKKEFVDAVREVLQMIASDEEGLQFLRDWQALEEQFDFHL